MSTDQDFLLPFHIEGGLCRGRLVRLGPALDAMLAPQAYPPVVGRLLGETAALAAALAGGLKYDGVFTLQAQGGGPVSLLMADVTSAGDLRAYARFDVDRIGAVEGVSHDRSVPGLLGQGHLAFTVDQGPHTDRYQGIVELSGGTLAECALQYFLQSEQIPTAMVLGARPPRESAGWRAGALVVQRMPVPEGMSREEAEEGWRRAMILLASLKTEELLDFDIAPARLLHRLYHADGLTTAEMRPLRAQCRCSEGRVASTLRSFPRREIEEMRDEAGRVVVTCQFCSAAYVFDDAAIDRLYADQAGP